jgi:MFS family permease
VTAFYGRFYDKVGYGKSILPALGALMAGYLLLFFSRQTALVFVGSLLMMCGYLSGSAVFGAMLRDRTPEGKAGMFQGLRIVAQVLIPGIVGPAIGAWVLRDAETVIGDDGTESFIPNQNIFLAALVAAVVLGLFLALLLYIMKKKTAKESAHE